MNIAQSSADMEEAHRFIRNEHIDAKPIAESGFEATTKQAQKHELLLALKDITNITDSHRSLRDEFGHVNGGNPHRGMIAHSILLFSPLDSEVVGLIEQSRWTRDIKTRGKEDYTLQPFIQR